MSALQMAGGLIGWLDRKDREALAYLIEENRILRAQLGGRRLRLTDDERLPYCPTLGSVTCWTISSASDISSRPWWTCRSFGCCS